MGSRFVKLTIFLDNKYQSDLYRIQAKFLTAAASMKVQAVLVFIYLPKNIYICIKSGCETTTWMQRRSGSALGSHTTGPDSNPGRKYRVRTSRSPISHPNTAKLRNAYSTETLSLLFHRTMELSTSRIVS